MPLVLPPTILGFYLLIVLGPTGPLGGLWLDLTGGTLTFSFSGLVLAEAVLSYVGIGVDPAMISWGNMINAARLELARDPVVWWSLLAAFVFMFGLVLTANLFADAVRDALDPRLRGS